MHSHQTLKQSNKQQRAGAMLPMIALTLVLIMIGVVFSVDIAFMHMVFELSFARPPTPPHELALKHCLERRTKAKLSTRPFG